jgi:hypothetical protein
VTYKIISRLNNRFWLKHIKYAWISNWKVCAGLTMTKWNCTECYSAVLLERGIHTCSPQPVTLLIYYYMDGRRLLVKHWHSRCVLLGYDTAFTLKMEATKPYETLESILSHNYTASQPRWARSDVKWFFRFLYLCLIPSSVQPEDGSNKVLRNSGTLQDHYTASQCRRARVSLHHRENPKCWHSTRDVWKVHGITLLLRVGT